MKGSNVCKIRKQFGRKDTRKRPLASFSGIKMAHFGGDLPLHSRSQPVQYITGEDAKGDQKLCTIKDTYIKLTKRDGPLLLTGRPLLKGMWHDIRAKFRCCY